MDLGFRSCLCPAECASAGLGCEAESGENLISADKEFARTNMAKRTKVEPRVQ